MSYSIWIVNAWDDAPGPTRCFEEIALALRAAFHALGYDAPIVRSPKDATGTVIVLGAAVLDRVKEKLPDDMIIYNFEQVHERGRFFAPGHPYIDYLRRWPVWEYSANNLRALKRRGIENVAMCRVGYMPELSRIPGVGTKDIDVLFIGSPQERRLKIMRELEARGARTHVIDDGYGSERDAFIARAKIVINIHIQPAQIFEIVRVSYLLANRVCVVSESGNDEGLEAPFREGVAFAEYEGLVDACMGYIADDAKRTALAEKGFKIFSRMPLVPLLAETLRRTAGGSARPRIFVQIASYRDRECQPTLEDMFAKATYPERVVAGVCLQLDPGEDRDCGINIDRPRQVRVRQVHYSESKGANWARAEAFGLWEGEEYLLQIDSHMRFEQGWDEMLIAMLERCPSEKPVISGYLPNYEPPDRLFHHRDSLLRVRVRTLAGPYDPQLIHVTGKLVPYGDDRCGLYPSPFFVANFMFTRPATLLEVPIDPYFRFYGDEISYAARLWTHGYDIFQPDRPVIYHHWVREETLHLQMAYRDIRNEKSRHAVLRCRHLLGLGRSDEPSAIAALEKYGLGESRRLDGLWAFAGIDWHAGSITADAEEGRWNMAARKKAQDKSSVAATGDAAPRIFVIMPSYRDPECHHTITDLFAQALHPERISIGLVWQYDADEDGAYLKVPYPRHEQVKVKHFALGECKGAGWARNEALEMWDGEPYILQVQAHMRFEPGWDDTLIEMLARCPSEKPAICLWPPSYNPVTGEKVAAPNRMQRTRVNFMGDASDPQFVHLAPEVMFEGDPRVGLYPTPWWVGCFMFAKNELFFSLRSDPHIYFYGEELAYSARLWTHGWELFQNDRPVAYHLWNRDDTADKQNYRALNDPRHQKTFDRIKHLLGIDSSRDAEVIADIEHYGLGSERSLESFYDYAGIDLMVGSVASLAQKGLWRHPLDREWGKGKIFVQIASYRDPECQHTIRDLFAKAKNPENIFVGLCAQYDPKDDAHCFEVPYSHPGQIREYRVDWRDAQGVCWARWMTQQLWRGEEYTLQIDSHMRFAEHWDVKAVAELAACDGERPVLTASIAKYSPPDELDTTLKASVLRAGVFVADGSTRNRGSYLNRFPKKPLNAAFISAGFMFSSSELIHDVPYDPFLYFDQEEIVYALRLYTHGWNVFSARKPIVYHFYIKPGQNVRPLAWSDVKKNKEQEQHYHFLRDRAMKRYNHITGYQSCEDPVTMRYFEHFGLGQTRSLRDFENYCGIDFATKRVSEYALRGRFIKGLAECLNGQIFVPELDDKEAKPVKLMSEQERMQRLKGLAPTVAQVKKSQATGPRIFVAIASYRDSECQHTVRDLFEKAGQPERISVGICWQFDPAADQHCFEVPYPHPAQVRENRWRPEQSQGMGWARADAMSLWDGEAYILQIDAHMRFEPGWDSMLVDMHQRLDDPMAAISAFLPDYEPPDKRSTFNGKVTRLRIARLARENHSAMVHLAGDVIEKTDDRNGFYPSPFVVGNFIFGPSAMFQAVPMDPFLFFHGDEVTYSLRLWTHGYTVYQPDKPLAYHRWKKEETKDSRQYKDIQNQRAAATFRRVRHLLGLEIESDEEILRELDRYGHGEVRDMEAFWKYAGVDLERRSLMPKAEKGRWNLGVLQPARADNNMLSRIFVQIASYRDPDCQWTVKDMFEKAAHPERIFAGICWQFDKEEDAHCFEVPYPRPQQVRVHEVAARESRGVCWARSLTQALWQGEEFTLQIDSHMRFEPGWDDILLSMWEDCASPKAVLTCYPGGFTPPDEIDRGWVFGMAAKEFDQHGIFLMKGAPAYRPDKAPIAPIPGAFASACMLFGPASIINDVPYDPNLYFFGEEIMLAVRLWTQGYDLYHPNRLCIYHNWERSKRRTHFSDHSNWGELNEYSFARVKHILGTAPSHDPAVCKDLDRYGLGKVRTLAAYQLYSGVDFSRKTFSDDAANGQFGAVETVLKKNGTDVMKKANGVDKERIFVQIASYRDRECQWTVKDLFEKAAYPDRITVGICWQFDPEEDKDCFEVVTRPEQVKIHAVNWRDAEGVCWARNRTQRMWDGEEYTLQTDAHMRFMQGWDEMMIEELAACPSQKPVISCSPASYVPPDKLEENPRPTVRRVHPFFPDGNLRGKGESLDHTPEIPLNGAFVAAGFVFSRSDIIREVPYDPYLYFDQEEITYAARLYTHGWDVFSSRKPMLYHYYNADPKGSVRPLHWRDVHKEDKHKAFALRERGLKRFNHMTAYALADDPEVTRELDVYGFGSVRTLAQFEEYCGVDFKRKVASDKAMHCGFIKDFKKYRTRPIVIREFPPKPPAQTGQNGQKQAPALSSSLPPLEPGDFIPLFMLTDTTQKTRGIEVHGGRHCLMVFLPAKNEKYVTAFFAALQKALKPYERPELWQIFIVDGSVEELLKLKEKAKIAHTMWSDPGGKVAGAFGICKAGDPVEPTGYVLDQNLKIMHRHGGLAPDKLAAALVVDCMGAIAAYKQKNAAPQVISEIPPVLIIPNALSPELCAKCIQAFRTGKTFEGTVGAAEKSAYRPTAKLRTDYIMSGELLAEIDDKFSRSIFPEIKKIFGFEVTHRELYKIGLYVGEKGGFFKQHRDNFDTPLGYRHIAMTVHLNDEYEGGGLHFPEYDNHVYRPAAGSAIAFSCATLHEARPVTKGERFIIVAFVHGDEDEAYRRQYQAQNNNPLKIDNFIPRIRRYPDLVHSRDFFKNWREENVHFDMLDGKALTKVAEEKPAAAPLAVLKSSLMINTLGGHKPKKVFESKSAIIFDDFLPEPVYQSVNAFALKTDYEYINTKGKISRAWHIHDGFPLRSAINLFYQAQGVEKMQGDHVYPSKTDLDPFVDHMLAIQPYAEHMVGKQTRDWAHFSVTGWIYPPGTGLSMHDDGSGVYSGAYVYFLNPTWRSHWGGLLILADEEGNRRVHEYRSQHNQLDFYNRKWLNANPLDELLLEHGFAKCVMPKKNRLVFLANDAYHMVTRVNEAAGDNVRMSLAGFFNRKK